MYQDARDEDKFIFKFSVYKTNKKCGKFLNYFLGVEDRNQLSYFDAFMRRLADGALYF